MFSLFTMLTEGSLLKQLRIQLSFTLSQRMSFIPCDFIKLSAIFTRSLTIFQRLPWRECFNFCAWLSACHQIYLVIDEIRRFQKDVYNFQEVSRFFFFPLSYGHYFSSIRFFQADSLIYFFLFFNIVRWVGLNHEWLRESSVCKNSSHDFVFTLK